MEICRFFFGMRYSKVRQTILPGNSKSLWKAVRMAKDISNVNLRKHMKYKYTDARA